MTGDCDITMTQGLSYMHCIIIDFYTIFFDVSLDPFTHTVKTISNTKQCKFLYREKKLEDTYFDKDVEKAFMGYSTPLFLAKTKPSLLIATEVGNMYTPSVYGGLASYISW